MEIYEVTIFCKDVLLANKVIMSAIVKKNKSGRMEATIYEITDYVKKDTQSKHFTIEMVNAFAYHKFRDASIAIEGEDMKVINYSKYNFSMK